MPKRIRNEPIYLAPKILGFRDRNDRPAIYDETTNSDLDPYSIDDKIFIYKRQVEEWFLNRALSLCCGENNNFIIVMIATSYIEGVEQYRCGMESNGRSRQMFSAGIRRIFGLQEVVSNDQLRNLYKHLRCGLFHNGMSGDAVVLSRTMNSAIEFSPRGTIDINPKLFLDAIVQDFNQYIIDLSNPDNTELRNNFNRMFTVV